MQKQSLELLQTLCCHEATQQDDNSNTQETAESENHTGSTAPRPRLPPGFSAEQPLGVGFSASWDVGA